MKRFFLALSSPISVVDSTSQLTTGLTKPSVVFYLPLHLEHGG